MMRCICECTGAIIPLELSVVMPCFQCPPPIFRASFKYDKVDYSGCVTEGTCKVVSINLGIFSTAPRRFEHCNLTRRALFYQQMETEGCIQKPALGFHMQMI